MDSSPNIIRVIKLRRMRWRGDLAPTGKRRGIYRKWVGKSEGERPLGKPKSRWKNKNGPSRKRMGA
jgi:hypothetical protein